MIKKTIIAVLTALPMLTSQLFAQTPIVETEPKQLFETYDPISSILDSLVTIDNVIRYKNANPLDYSASDAGLPTVVPVFSDAVYAERMSKINSPIELTYNSEVKKYIDLYAVKKRGLTSRVMGLSSLYFPLYEETLEKNNLPLEFKYLSIVESALNPTAQSHCGATGLWQFMFNTGKMYGLEMNSYIDERRDPIKSTEAACKYFLNMYEIYHDWLLVIASYNCGPGNVNKAIIRSGGKTNFWEIARYLPAETRGYVPAFIAVTYLMHNTREHNLFPVPPSITYFETDTVVVNSRITFATLSKTLDIPIDVLSFLNPIYKKQQTLKSGTSTLRIPTNKMAAFVSKQSLIEQQEIALAATPPAIKMPGKYNQMYDPNITYEYVQKTVKKTHIVKKGETLASIANKYDTEASDIKKLNRMKSTKVLKGQKLTVMTEVTQRVAVKKPKTNVDSLLAILKDSVTVKDTSNDTAEIEQNTNDTADSSESILQKTSNNKQKQNEYVYHYVQRGDTLYSIAREYQGVTIDQLMKMNNLNKGKDLKAGMKLKVKVGG